MRPRTTRNEEKREPAGARASRRSAGPIGERLAALAGRLAEGALAAPPLIGRAVVRPYIGGTALADLAGDRANPLQFGSDGFSGYRSELIAMLATFRRRLWLFRSIILAIRTGLLALAVALVFRFLDLAGILALQAWLTLIVAAILAVGFGLIFAQHVSYLEVARVVDRQLGLKAQLGTAVELTFAGEPTSLARSQVRQATLIARRLSARQAVSLRAPWRDIRLASFALAGVLVISLLISVGFKPPTPEQLSQAGLEALDPALNSWYELDPASAAEMNPAERGATGLQATVDRLREQLDRNEISPIEYETQVAAVEDEIRQQAAESARQQAALTDLARALSETSATRDAAESLNRGDYSGAVGDLNDLAGQTGQLSEQARQDLANRLESAARDTASTNEALSQSAERAAEALRSGDQAAAEQALRDLASEVASASEQVASQSDLGEALQGAQDAQAAIDPSASGEPGATDGTGGTTDTAPSGSGEGTQPADDSPGSPMTSSGAGSVDSTGGGAGSSSGEKVTAANAPNQPLTPDAGDKVLKIIGRPSGAGSTVRTDTPTNAPVTSTSSGTTSIQSSGSRSNEQVNTVGEMNDVPLDLRSVVRDYFTGSE